VRATIGSATAEVALPELTVTVNWQTGQVSATGPATTAWTLATPTGTCFGAPVGFGPGGGGGGGTTFRAGQTNAQGALTTQIPAPDPGDGIQVAFLTTEGHRFYRQVFRSLGQVFVHTDRVTGRATPLSPVTLILQSAGGTERGRDLPAAGLEEPALRWRALSRPRQRAVARRSSDTRGWAPPTRGCLFRRPALQWEPASPYRNPPGKRPSISMTARTRRVPCAHASTWRARPRGTPDRRPARRPFTGCHALGTHHRPS
jgi:hypothetical protein